MTLRRQRITWLTNLFSSFGMVLTSTQSIPSDLGIYPLCFTCSCIFKNALPWLSRRSRRKSNSTCSKYLYFEISYSTWIHGCIAGRSIEVKTHCFPAHAFEGAFRNDRDISAEDVTPKRALGKLQLNLGKKRRRTAWRRDRGSCREICRCRGGAGERYGRADSLVQLSSTSIILFEFSARNLSHLLFGGTVLCSNSCAFLRGEGKLRFSRMGQELRSGRRTEESRKFQETWNFFIHLSKFQNFRIS